MLDMSSVPCGQSSTYAESPLFAKVADRSESFPRTAHAFWSQRQLLPPLEMHISAQATKTYETQNGRSNKARALPLVEELEFAGPQSSIKESNEACSISPQRSLCSSFRESRSTPATNVSNMIPRPSTSMTNTCLITDDHSASNVLAAVDEEMGQRDDEVTLANETYWRSQFEEDILFPGLRRLDTSAHAFQTQQGDLRETFAIEKVGREDRGAGNIDDEYYNPLPQYSFDAANFYQPPAGENFKHPTPYPYLPDFGFDPAMSDLPLLDPNTAYDPSLPQWHAEDHFYDFAFFDCTHTDATTESQHYNSISQNRSEVPRSNEESETRGAKGTKPSRKDKLLLAWKRQGMSYREIKEKGNFDEAESTLRGRYRTLTKPKEARVRKPSWPDRALRSLDRIVAQHVRSASRVPLLRNFSSKCQHHRSREDFIKVLEKISWKQVSERMAEEGCYRYGNSTVKKMYYSMHNLTASATW